MSVGHDEYWSGAAAGERRGGPGRRRQPRVLQRQRGLLEDPVGAEHRRRPARPTARWSATRRPGPTPRSTRDREWTGTWRDPRFSPPSDGGRPENALTGTLFMVNGRRTRHQGARRPTARCGSGATRASPTCDRARPRRCPRTRSATSGTRTSTTGSGPAGLDPACRTTTVDTDAAVPAPTSARRSAAGTTDAPPHAVPGGERCARVRRRHRPVVLGARRQPRRPTSATRPTRACSRRRSTCSPTWACSRPRCSRRPGGRDRVDRHHRADGDHQRRRPPDARLQVGTPGDHLRHRGRHRRRRGRRASRSPPTAAPPGIRPPGRATWTYTFTPTGRRHHDHRPRAIDDSANIESHAGDASGHRDRARARIFGAAVPGSPGRPTTTSRSSSASGSRARRRLHHRRPLLQGRRQHRHPHRHAVDRRRHAAGDRHVHQRDGDRLAEVTSRTPVAVTAEHDLRRVVLRAQRPLLRRRPATSRPRARRHGPLTAPGHDADGSNGVYRDGRRRSRTSRFRTRELLGRRGVHATGRRTDAARGRRGARRSAGPACGRDGPGRRRPSARRSRRRRSR